MPAHSVLAAHGYVKRDLADRLRAEIMNGSLPRGVRIIEGKWAQRFGVAQGSIREAINILALEGLVARLAVEARPDLSKLQSAVDGMRRAANEGNCEALLQCDLQFHLDLCELSGNSFIVEQSRRLLVPFFAFVRMRVTASGQTTSPWDKDLEAHQRIIDLLREAEGEVAEQYVKKAMARFAKTAYDNWENRNTHAG